jgi:heat shock protein HtpX
MMRVGLLLATNFAVLMVAGIIMSLLGLDQGSTMGLLLFCALFGFGGSFISLMLSKSMAKRGSGTQIIETPSNETEQWLFDRIAAHAEASNIGMPEVGIFGSPQPNAFATGWNKNKSLVAVSAGLLNNFPRDEVDAVLAHEIGHVANGDMITLTLIQGITNTFVLFFARMAAMVIAGAARNRAMGTMSYYMTSWVFQALFGILATMIVMWFSRRREFRADEAGARLTTPKAMANALERLKTPISDHDALPKGMAAMGISPNFKSRLGGLMATHPSLDDRIAALRASG